MLPLGADLLLAASFEDVAQLVLGGFSGGPALAPARHRGGDRIVGAPGAVGEFVEVIAGLGFAIEIGDVDAVREVIAKTEVRMTREGAKLQGTRCYGA